MGIPTTAPAPPELERDAPLAPLTSIRVGGPADRHYFGTALFIDHKGNVMGRAGDKQDEILYADIDPKACDDVRDLWGFFKFLRPDAYSEILKDTI